MNEILFRIWYLITFADVIFLASCSHNALLVFAAISKKKLFVLRVYQMIFLRKRTSLLLQRHSKFLRVRTEI